MNGRNGTQQGQQQQQKKKTLDKGGAGEGKQHAPAGRNEAEMKGEEGRQKLELSMDGGGPGNGRGGNFKGEKCAARKRELFGEEKLNGERDRKGMDGRMDGWRM